MRNISVPWGSLDPLPPNIAPTYWRTVLDHGRRVYYFESTLSPFVVAVDLKTIDFKPGSGVRSIALEGEEAFKLSGEINAGFKPADPIRYIAP